MKMKRILSIILALVMAAGLLAAAPVVTNAAGDPEIRGWETLHKKIAGHAAFSIGPLDIVGNGDPGSAVTVTKLDGHKSIAWNAETKSIDVPANLPIGRYPFRLHVSNGLNALVFTTYICVLNGPNAPVIIDLSDGTMTLVEGYEEAVSTKRYSVEGTPKPTVKLADGGSALINWDENEYRIVVSPGLTPGDHTVELVATNTYKMEGIDDLQVASDSVFFTVTVEAAVAPSITGPEALELELGYEALSSAVYTVKGNPPPKLSAESTSESIVWNSETMQFDIAAGLEAGSYTAALTAESRVDTDELTFTVTVTDPNAPPGGEEPEPPEKGIFGTNAKWYGEWWHYLLFFGCFGFIWMWF